jgi:hypothetical protein
MNEKSGREIACFFVVNTTAHIPEITRASLYYLGWLPNTSVEIGSKNRMVR